MTTAIAQCLNGRPFGLTRALSGGLERHLSPERTNQPAAFRRLAQDLRVQILRGDYPVDTPLPTEAALARQYSVSRQTVRRAFQDLVSEGIVFRVPGRGTFSTPSSGRYLRQFGSVQDLMSLSEDSEMRVIQPLVDIIDPATAGRLNLDDDRVATTSFLRLNDGTAFSHTSVFLPPRIRSQLGEPPELSSAGTVSQATVIGLLDRVLNLPIQDAQQSITVSAAPDDVAEYLNVPPRTALLRIDRMYYDSAAGPVELAISHFHPDRYSYRVRLRRNLTESTGNHLLGGG